jgi:diacylglycerol kinase family enzyme
VIPAIVNSATSDATDVAHMLRESRRFAVSLVPPGSLAAAVHRAAASRAPRVLVAGGDGTLRTAAALLVGTATEMAILPSGTLNHFATDLGVPSSVDDAIAIATNGVSRAVDVGRVNDRMFLNTSSVGSYVGFVLTRDRIEEIAGYRLASVVAAGRMLFHIRTTRVRVEVDGVERTYETPLVFVGVGERELKLPTLGSRIEGGQSGLHVMVVRRRSGARVLALALAAATRGIESVARTPALDAFLVDRCTIETTHHHIGVDGEVVTASSPLEYALQREALRVVVPA